MPLSTYHLLCMCTLRFNSAQILSGICIFTCITFALFQYFSVHIFKSEHISSAKLTRLYPDLPITIDLKPYSVCHPNELNLHNLTLEYYRKYPTNENQTCFIIQHLDGGPWLSYITHEFAEILLHLKVLGNQSNIKYRTFSKIPGIQYRRNLTEFFLNLCNIDKNLPKEKQVPIILLLWDFHRFLHHEVRDKLNSLLKSTRLRLVVFIDDLHYGIQGVFRARQYLFESIASEILSTYPYLFQNYYEISPKKLTWVPHAASSLLTRTINQSAENVLFVSGANLIDWYPCRAIAFEICKTRPDLTSCLEHPGYGVTVRNDSSLYHLGERYFSYMKRYVFGLATCQSVHYAIAKLFEIPANGLVLVTTNDLVDILVKLHLYPNEHFLTTDCSSSNNLINGLIQIQSLSKEKILDIRQKSQEVIFQRHLTKHRAELVFARLLSQALIASSTSNVEQRKWERWGRDCQ